MEGVSITTEYGTLYNSSALSQHRKLKNEDNYLCFCWEDKKNSYLIVVTKKK